MPNKKRFSKRSGFYTSKSKKITVREDAPNELRDYIPLAFYELGKEPSDLREIVCKILKKAPDRNNWSERPNIEREVNQLLENCDWFLVYDVIEAISEKLHPQNRSRFEDDINEFFKLNGIGWKIENSRIITRGDEAFETTIDKVEEVLKSAKMITAQGEIKEALSDLSRRPDPDITGAIQHSLACLECVSREITGDKNSTMGAILKKNPGFIPPPLDQAVHKIWGYSSEQGRHLKEGNPPGFLEAELVVEVTAAISTYLGKKIGGSENNEDDDLSF